MVVQTSLLRVGSFHFEVKHVLIIGILMLSFSTSFLIRSQNTDYGFELNEFDPFFNFRATEYIVDNGLSEYFDWHDVKSWHPNGRDVSATSQVMLHITAAIAYQIFGGGSSLYDFTILFPAIIGSLTVIVMFALVRLFAGLSAGLVASMLFAISLPIVLRGTAGWFKSEPLGIFYGLLGLYLFLSGIKSENKKIAISKIILGGVIMSFGLASWGGNQFFIMPLGLFIICLPFVRKDHVFLFWSVPLFTVIFLLVTSLFERPGPNFVFGLGGFSLIIPTVFLMSCTFIQKMSKEENKIRNGLILLISFIVIGSFFVVTNTESDFLPMPSFRYLNAINPFLTTTNPLVDSVSEHATTTISQSFFLHSALLIFSGLGVWLLLTKSVDRTRILVKNDMNSFVLIMGMMGVYVSSAFIRLEVFASISLIILSSIGLSHLTTEIFKTKSLQNRNYAFKISYVAIILALFVTPLTFPADGNWINAVDIPPTILNGGTVYPASDDWLETLDWIKMNTSEDAVVVSWWDYGYWITTISERTTVADNATIDSKQIKNIAKIFLNSPDESWGMLREMDADYVVVFVAAQNLDVDNEGQPLYVMGGGGDESKKQWFMRIAEVPLSKYLYSDGMSGTDYFWNETLLGKMIPFTTLTYHNFQTQQQSEIFRPGFSEISVKEIKYNSDSDPLKLVYASSSFTDENSVPVTGVLVYEINENYVSIIP